MCTKVYKSMVHVLLGCPKCAFLYEKKEIFDKKMRKLVSFMGMNKAIIFPEGMRAKWTFVSLF